MTEINRDLLSWVEQALQGDEALVALLSTWAAREESAFARGRVDALRQVRDELRLLVRDHNDASHH